MSIVDTKKRINKSSKRDNLLKDKTSDIRLLDKQKKFYGGHPRCPSGKKETKGLKPTVK